jgi:hypothetical protein
MLSHENLNNGRLSGKKKERRKESEMDVESGEGSNSRKKNKKQGPELNEDSLWYVFSVRLFLTFV